MEIQKIRGNPFFLSMLGSLFLFFACNPLSEKISDETAGTNGGFEITESGLPVNWLLYTPKTVKEGDFEITLDTAEFKEGKQSLKFIVKECSRIGGNKSPGFSREFNRIPNGNYKLSFWVKNDGCEFIMAAGGVTPKTGNMKYLVKTREQIDDWKLYEYEIEFSKEYESLRIQLNILSPGTLWIDDFSIEASS